MSFVDLFEQGSRIFCVARVILLSAVLVMSCWAGDTGGQLTSKAANASNQPLDLKQVTVLATATGITLQRFTAIVNSRGLNFTVTDDVVGQLTRQGASTDKLRALKAAPQPPPPIVRQKQDPTGSLSVSCGPPECDISINGRPSGSTSGGNRTITGLSPGWVYVDLSKKNPPYLNQEVHVEIQLGQITQISIRLEPANATRQLFGAEMLRRFITALGGKNAIEASRLFTGEGEIGLFNSIGLSTTYQLKLKAVLPTMIALEVTDSRRRKAVVLIDESVNGRGLRTKGRAPDGLEKAGRLFLQLLPASVLTYIQERRMEVSAEQLPQPNAEEVGFSAGSTVLGFDVQLQPDTLFPISVRRELPIGSLSEASFSDFSFLGHAVFPKHLTIRYSADSREGAEFTFRSVALMPSYEPNDFR